MALCVSAVLDILRAGISTRESLPEMPFNACIEDKRSGIQQWVRARTDDVYTALPGREGPVEEAILGPLRSGDVFVDCGANIGFYALRAAQRVGPEGVVIAVEPVASTAAQLARNATLNGATNISIIEAAVGAQRGGKAKFVAPPHSFARAMVIDAAPTSSQQPLQELGDVDVMTLDEVCAPHSSIRVLKLDVEGAELAALHGAGDALRKVHTIVLERNRDAEEIMKLVTESGFAVEEAGFTSYLTARRQSVGQGDGSQQAW
jgi:FkbM family methyltransferase